MIQIYNNLQVLWNSKVKFVSLSQLLGLPLFWSDSGPFTDPGLIVSFAGEAGEGKRKTGKAYY